MFMIVPKEVVQSFFFLSSFVQDLVSLYIFSLLMKKLKFGQGESRGIICSKLALIYVHETCKVQVTSKNILKYLKFNDTSVMPPSYKLKTKEGSLFAVWKCSLQLSYPA